MNTELTIVEITKLADLKARCEGKNVYLYGAGMRATAVAGLLAYRGINIFGYVVSSMQGNQSEKNGYPVMEAELLIDENAIVIFSIDIKNREKCYEIVSPAITKIYIFEDTFYNEEFFAFFRYKFKQIFPEEEYVVVENAVVERNHLLCRHKDMYFRVPPHILYNDYLGILRKKLEERDPEQFFYLCYGKFDYLPKHENKCLKKNHSYSVYMARCHVDKFFDMPDMPEWIIPIQTGAALTDKVICKVRDNQGENISVRNKDYSECTAIYWMWKNAPKTDYIGLCHYRRHFDFPNGDITIIGNSDYDIVATVPTLVTNNYECFRQFVTDEDIKVLYEAVKKLFPGYYGATEKYYDNIFCPPCNMFIMKYDIFQKYCQFAFGVTEYIDKYYQKKGVIRNDRFMGFLMESLTDIFLVKHSDIYKIAYTDMKFLG